MAMTHPIVEAVAERIAQMFQEGPTLICDVHRMDAREIVAEVLRLARTPSKAQTAAWRNLHTDPHLGIGRGVHAWQDGIDALLREVEG